MKHPDRFTHYAQWLARPWWIGLAVTLMGGLWLRGASGIASTTHHIGLGPQMMVYVAGVGLTLSGLVLIVQALRGNFTPAAPETPEAAAPDAPEAPAARQALRLTLAGVGLPLLTIGWLGFPLTAMLSFALVTRAFGSRRTVRDLALGALLGGLAWYGFSRLGLALGAFLPWLR